MARNLISSKCVVEIDTREYEDRGRFNGRMQLIDPVTGSCYAAPDAEGVLRPITDEQFEELLLAGRASIKRRRSNNPTRAINDACEATIAQATQIDAGAPKRLAQCQMLDDAGVPNGRKAIERHLALHWKGELVERYGDYDPPASIERWRFDRGHVGSRHAAQMIRMTGKVERGPYKQEVVAELLQKHALAKHAARIRISSGYNAMHAELEDVNLGRHPDYAQPDVPYQYPSYDTFRRRCNALEQRETLRSERGAQAVEQFWMGAGRPLTADFAMQRVIIDHTRLDLFVIHRMPDGECIVLGRPWLTLAIDVATRAVVGYLISFIAPSIWTVGEIIWRMAMPKHVPAEMALRYPMLRQIRGRPVELVVDNAVEFRSHVMEAAARSAGFTVRFCPVKRPRYRGVGERAIGTVGRLIVDDLAGRTVPIDEARLTGYDAVKDAIAFMDDVETVAMHAVAIYNTEPHSGIGERQPALLFAKDAERNGINNFIDLEAFRRDLMAVQEKAQLSNSGIIAFNGLRYHDFEAVPSLLDDLRPLECRRQRRDGATATVDFRYDPMDIGRIHVWNRKRRTYVTLVCTDELYAGGLPEFIHDQIREQLKRDGKAFNTPEERAAARSRLLRLKIDLDPGERDTIHTEMARLYDVPRIRQITGSIAKLELRPGQHVEQGDFVGHDRAALTNFDNEVLSTRPEPRNKDRGSRRDRRGAGEPAATATAAAENPGLRRRMPREKRA